MKKLAVLGLAALMAVGCSKNNGAQVSAQIEGAGNAEVVLYQLAVNQVKTVDTIKTGADADGLNLEDMSKEELQSLLEDLERKLAILRGDEPEDDESDEYEEWEDEIEELEAQIEEVQEAIDNLKD